MTLRGVAFAATLIAVGVLLASMVHGLREPPPELSAEPPTTGEQPVARSQRIRVEVLNGAGIPGLAREVTERLRREGFDVVHYGNAGSMRRDSTTILDRSGNGGAIAELVDALDLDRIETAIDTSLYLEATIVLAPDWRRP